MSCKPYSTLLSTAWKSLLMLIATFSPVYLEAQVNYVLNPSFEQYSHCPTQFDQIMYATYWSPIDTVSPDPLCSPEYCNLCAGSNPYIGVPRGGFYYHYPRSGNGMVLTEAYFDNSFSALYYRDYTQGRLSQSLLANKSYCVTFYVTLGYVSQYAVNRMGAYLDDGSIDKNQDSLGCATPQTAFNPQIIESDIIFDSINWVKIQGNYIANGNERFITIGNFKNNDVTDTVRLQTPTQRCCSWYLIDDVSIIESDANANAGPDKYITTGDSVRIGTNEEGMPETWYIADSTKPIGYSGGLWVKPTMTTSYVVEMDLCGNVTYDTVKVYVCSKGAPASSVVNICIGEKSALSTATTGGTWSNNNPGVATIDTENSVKGVSKGVSVITYIEPEGCLEITTVTVRDCGSIVVHDVITPNGDGVNDTWVIEGMQPYPSNTVQVYDKFGDKVFEKVNYNNDWGGNGLPDGTYYYLVKLNTPNLKGGQNTWVGWLLIKR